MADDIYINPLERILLSNVLGIMHRSKLKVANEISQLALEYAAQHLGANKPELRIKPLPKTVVDRVLDRERRKIDGFWDQKSTAYMTLPDDEVELMLTAAHEPAHPVHLQLWPAAEEYKSISQKIRKMKRLAEVASRNFFYMDLGSLSPETHHTRYVNGDVVEDITLGDQDIERTVYNTNGKEPDTLSWNGVNISPSEVLSRPNKFYKVKGSISDLPQDLRDRITSILDPVTDYLGLKVKRLELNKVVEVWCEFFAYVIANDHGIPIDDLKQRLRRKMDSANDGSVQSETTLTQMVYSMTERMEKLGGDGVTVLKESLQATSIPELQAILGSNVNQNYGTK